MLRELLMVSEATLKRQQSSGAVWIEWWAWALIPYSTLSSVPLSLINCMVSVDVKHQETRSLSVRGQELCEQEGGPGLSFPIPLSPGSSLISHRLMHSVDVKHHERRCWQLRKCVKEEVAVLGSPSLIVRTVSVGVKQYWNKTKTKMLTVGVLSVLHSLR